MTAARELTQKSLAVRAEGLRRRASRKLAAAEKLLDRADGLTADAPNRGRATVRPPVLRWVPLARIDADPAGSVRAKVDPDAVDRYREADPGEFPPVLAFAYPDPDQPEEWLYCLGDGAYRLLAAEANGREEMPALVEYLLDRQSAEDAAYSCAFGANLTHGMPRSPGDCRAAVDTALQREQCERLNDRTVAALCGVRHPFVRQRRELLSESGVIPPSSKAHASRQKYPPKPPADARPMSLLGKLTADVARHLRVAGVKTLGDLALCVAEPARLPGLAPDQRAALATRLAGVGPA